MEKRKLYQRTLDSENEGQMHRDISEEVQFFHNVYSGNIDAVRQNIDERRFRDTEGVGTLSVDPVQNLKYHMVVTASIITRGCIEKGLEAERSFRMSDYYIRKLDHATTEDQVEAIHADMVLDFAGKMRLIHKENRISRPIRKCLDYIYAHIYERVSLNDLAAYTGISPGYLSRLFSSEIGVPLSDYIREKKIELSQVMLLNSDKSILDIACQFSFSSQSHYIQAFKKVVGMTPKKYRTIKGGERYA